MSTLTATKLEKPPRFRFSLSMLTMVLILAAILVFFLALVAAYFFAIPQSRFSTAPVPMPAVFWLSTLVLLLSSASLERARFLVRRAQLPAYRWWLTLTACAGVLFLGLQGAGMAQLAVTPQLAMENLRGNMYYVFSTIHGLHLIGGIGGLWWLLRKSMPLEDGEESPLRRHRNAALLTATYWHFMGAIWLMLLAMLYGYSS